MKIAIIDQHPLMGVGPEKRLSEHVENSVILESDSIVHFRKLCPDEVPDMVIMKVLLTARSIWGMIPSFTCWIWVMKTKKLQILIKRT